MWPMFRSQKCGLDLLLKRRMFNDVSCIFKLVSGRFGGPDLVYSIKFNVSSLCSRTNCPLLITLFHHRKRVLKTLKNCIWWIKGHSLVSSLTLDDIGCKITFINHNIYVLYLFVHKDFSYRYLKKIIWSLHTIYFPFNVIYRSYSIARKYFFSTKIIFSVKNCIM